MSENIQESLSALLDGEIDAQEADHLLGRIRGNDELRRLWGRYHMVGDLIRGEKMLIDASSLADRVQASLRDEPAIIASPNEVRRQEEVQAGNVTPISAREKPFAAPAPSWRRLAVGAALAASVAAMAVFISPILTGENGATPTLASVPEPTQATVTTVDADGNRWKKLPSDVEARLSGYLVQHSDYASVNMVGGMLPYTSVVSYDRNR